MPAPLSRLRPALEPSVAALYLLLWIVAEVGRSHGDTFALTLVAYTASIALARLVPWASLAIVVSIPVLQVVGLLGHSESTTWAIAGASIPVAFFVALSAPRTVAWAALVVVVCQAGLISITLVFSGQWVSWNTVGVFVLASGDAATSLYLGAIGVVLCATGWTAGFATSIALKRRRERAILQQTEAELIEAAHELRSVTERTAIAQEVHDVLAHSLAVVIAVADGSRYLRETRPETTDGALREIADTARAALIDVRSLIEALHDESSNRPQPGLADLEGLVSRLSSAGLPVQFETFGAPQPLTRSQELAVFRIVQESLTNALKHGGSHPAAVVTLNWEGPGLAVSVTSQGVEHAAAGPVPQASGDGLGHYGIRNMSDRAHLAGGWLRAGFDDAAGADGAAFVVTAYIPTDPVVSA